MVQLDEIRAANAKLVNSQPLVAVFVGATSGIGEYTLRELVRSHAKQGNGLCIYIVGRNAQSANTIIEDCTAMCPDGQYHFVQAADLSLLQNVDTAVEAVAQHQREHASDAHVPRVDLLFMTQGGLYLQARQDTAEGIDFAMSMHYYSRARFVYQLLPLLHASSLPAHVVSVCAAGMEATLQLDDLSLRKAGNYGFANARSHCTFMTTAFMEHVAGLRRPGAVSLVNVFPGLVITPAFWKPEYPAWFRVVWALAAPFARLVALAPEEAGQRMLFMATDRFPGAGEDGGGGNGKDGAEVVMGTDGVVGSGAYACNYKGEATSMAKREQAYKGVSSAEWRKDVWDHTMKAFDAAAAGTEFAD